MGVRKFLVSLLWGCVFKVCAYLSIYEMFVCIVLTMCMYLHQTAFVSLGV